MSAKAQVYLDVGAELTSASCRTSRLAQMSKSPRDQPSSPTAALLSRPYRLPTAPLINHTPRTTPLERYRTFEAVSIWPRRPDTAMDRATAEDTALASTTPLLPISRALLHRHRMLVWAEALRAIYEDGHCDIKQASVYRTSIPRTLRICEGHLTIVVGRRKRRLGTRTQPPRTRTSTKAGSIYLPYRRSMATLDAI